MSQSLFTERLVRRDKIQLLADIIKVSKKEIKMTKIIRLANIQYSTFQDCIDTLCNAALLEKVRLKDKSRRLRDARTKIAYKATEMGIKWCQMVDEIYKKLEDKT